MKNTIHLFTALLIILIFLLSHPAQSQNLAEINKIVASNRISSAKFGHSVAISGDYMVVGAAEKGFAYIFKKDNTNNWVQIKVIAKASINFGVSVAISGDYIVVGAKHAKNGSITFVGAAFVFKKDIGGTDNWGEIKQIVASDREYNDLFGASVAISGDYIVVGAPWEDPLAANGSYQSDAGSAYVFKKDQGGTDNWGQVKKIGSSILIGNANFGESVAISGDYIAVGLPNNNIYKESFVFKKDQGGTDNWGVIKQIVQSDGATNDNFGCSVAMSGDYMVVGAKSAKDGSITGVGSAYIFKKDQGGTDNWGQVKKIVASDRAQNDLFGVSVAISGDYIVVGAYYEDQDASGYDTMSKAGSAYVFKKDQDSTDNWGQLQKIVASDRAASDYFGNSVAISGDYIVVGAYFEDQDASGYNTISAAGSAYVFEFVFPVITGPNSNTGPSSSISIYENTATVHTFSADQTVSWSLGSANDEALLSINSNGNLVFTSAPDYETPLSKSNSNTYIVAVIATDQYNTSATQTLTITVLDFPNTNFGSFDSITKYYFSGSSTIIAPTTNNSNQIIYTSDNAAIATVSGSVITFTGVGTANITATQAADANHEGNAVSSVLTVLGRVTKYGGLASTDMNYVDANGKVGGAFGIDQYGRRINISYVNYGLSSSTAGLYKTTYTGYFNDDVSFFATATAQTFGANPSTSVQTTAISEPISDDGSNFSCQWLGYFKPTTTETYTFYTSSDDASYAWIGSNAQSGFTTANAIVQNGGTHATIEKYGTIALTAGVYYPIRIQFGENGGGDVLSFSFSTPTISKTSNVTGLVFCKTATNGF